MTDRVFLWAATIGDRFFVRYFWNYTTSSVWVGISGGLRVWEEPRQFQPVEYGTDLTRIHEKIMERLSDGQSRNPRGRFR